MAKQLFVAVVIALCLVSAFANDEDNISTKYKCGTECDEKKMDSSDLSSDSMPTKFGPEIPLGSPALPVAMNAYLPSDLPSNLPVQGLSNGVFGMPDNDKGMTGLHALSAADQIPYEPARDVPALRRPCNLEEVAELLRSIKQEYQAEDTHDAHLHAATLSGPAPLLDAQRALDDANTRVQELLEAKQANETLTTVLLGLSLRADLLQSTMVEKGVLLSEEGTLKAPILKSIGRTNINLQSTVSAKQAAMNEISTHPAFTKEEIQKVTSTYDELIFTIKKQLDDLHKEAADVLIPVQLKINQTEHTIDRLQSEIIELQKEQNELSQTAQKYSPIALETAQAIAAAALSHFNAQKEVQKLDLSGFDQRSKDRSDVTHIVDQMLTLVLDIQQPQDPKDKFVESTKKVQSLSGSVPRRPFQPARAK
eukprot:c17517_g1_i1.p1 GENE.c17517_g1_i1~~c17517_g1_i1.p1  ORF type:complete len:437 (+),score=142.24 c17517_g1_i1:43-1311(+)